jgi:molybdate transport system ATP-binding protein
MNAATAMPWEVRCQLQRPGFALDVDLNLPARGVTALFGPSGSGKTSCLRVIAGLEPGATGRVSLFGETWQDSAQGVFRAVHQRAVGYVFQEASLFEHLTVEGNLKFGFQRTPPAQRRHGWDHGLAMLGLAHLLKRHPHELSGGERQRVAIARALAASPRVLLMDEPLAALDAQRKADILPWLEQLHEGLDMPVVYVTHSLEEVTRLADHLVVLDQGKVQASGAVIDLLGRLDLPMAHNDEASCLIEATVSGAPGERAGFFDGLDALDFAGGTLLLPTKRTTPWPQGLRVRVRIQARDVSLALTRAEDSSVLNILPATVTALQAVAPGQVMVGLRLGNGGDVGPGGTRMLSRISALSAQRLALAPGSAVWAQIKGVAMVR